MMKDNLKSIKSIDIKKNMKVSELVEGFGGMGFNANKISKASEILKEQAENLKNLISFFKLDEESSIIAQGENDIPEKKDLLNEQKDSIIQ